MLRIVIVLIALLAAGVASVLTARYLSNQEQLIARANNAQAVPMTDVLVSATDLDIGQTVSERSLVWQPWPKDAVNQKYITRQQEPDAIKTLAGTAVREPLFAGDPVTRARLVTRENASVLSVILREGFRAVTIKVDEAQGLAGLVKPGDKVDVILTHRITTPTEMEARAERTVSEVIAHGVRVLAVGQEIRGEDESKPAKTITVEVDPGQAEAIALGHTMGSLTFALRSAFADTAGAERERPYTSDADISNLLREGHQPHSVALVATRELPPGTLLAESDIEWRALPPDAEPGLYFDKEKDGQTRFHGSLLLDPLEAGQPIQRTRLIQPRDGRFIPLALRPGYRAVSVAIAQNTAVGGFVSPGDLVDVIYVDEVDSGSSDTVLKKRSWSETVARAVRVLAIETALDPKTQLPTVGGTVTIEATPRQVEMIALAANMGNLSLALRPQDQGNGMVADGEDSSDVSSPATFTVDTVMSSGLRGLVGKSYTPGGGGMLVIRGTQRSFVETRP